jgi:multidrug efflux pump subunit AcrA (membrane-fusion protein)
MPVQTVAVSLAPVPQSSEYVATIKSRRSATMQPQVDGRLTEIAVRSGDHVKAGDLLMSIDPLHQQEQVDSQRATERQKKALLDYKGLAHVDRSAAPAGASRLATGHGTAEKGAP